MAITLSLWEVVNFVIRIWEKIKLQYLKFFSFINETNNNNFNNQWRVIVDIRIKIGYVFDKRAKSLVSKFKYFRWVYYLFIEANIEKIFRI